MAPTFPHDTDRLPGNIIPFPAGAIRRTYARRPRQAAAGRPLRGIVLACVGTLLALGACWLGAEWIELHRVSRHIARIPGAFSAPAAARPVKPAAAARSVNVLIAGLDGEPKVGALPSRSDAIMVLHLDADRARAWFVSVPRDTWVSLPGRGENRVNAAYPIGGPALFVRTLEELTRLHMDHLVVIDFTGFRRLTDAVGGVAMSLGVAPQSVPDSARGSVALEMPGPVALDYVRERLTLPHGDLDRIRRQQHFLGALLGRVRDRQLLSDPSALRALASAIGDAVRVDTGFTTSELLALTGSVRRMRPEDVTFLTAPALGVAQKDAASVLLYDQALGDRLWSAMARDSMPTFVAAHPELVTPRDVP